MCDLQVLGWLLKSTSIHAHRI